MSARNSSVEIPGSPKMNDSEALSDDGDFEAPWVIDVKTGAGVTFHHVLHYYDNNQYRHQK